MAQISCVHSSLIKLFFCVSFFAISKSQDWAFDDEGCRTPDRGVGDCIPVRDCQPMKAFLMNSKRPLSQKVINRLNAYTCSYEANQVNVCCPSDPIIIEDDTAPIPTTEPNRTPPDVTNHKNFNLLPIECGYLKSDDKIRFGLNASLNEFPWMAIISYNTRRGPQFKCGGSIINERYILTAAHCISGTKDPLLGVRVGEHNILTRTDCETLINGKEKCADPVQDLSIEEILIHPGYNTTIISNDIGLLRVSKMNLKVANVRPVCLPIDSSRDAQFKNVIVTGWGVTDSGQSSMILQKVALPVVGLEECQNVYKADPRARITYKQLCAGGKDQKDSCPGDSGGPLQVAAFLNDETRYVQQGVVSFGPRICGLEGYPGVYTRVAFFMDWILDSIKS